MPIFRYFIVVGIVLLTLMVISDRYFALPPVAGVAAEPDRLDRSMLRITSDQKWPERIVFDTRMVAPPHRPNAVVASSASATGARTDPRMALAAMVPSVPQTAAPHASQSRVKAERRVRQRVVRQPRPSALASLQPGGLREPWFSGW